MEKKSEKISSNSNQLESIVDVLGILDERGLSKDWLLLELKRHHIKSKSPSTGNTSDILRGCTQEGIEKFLKILKKEDFPIKDLKTLTKTLHWFFIDIVLSSDPSVSVKAQARKIYALNSIIEKTETFKKSHLSSLVILPTGDGMAIGFPDSVEKPVLLAIELHKALRKYNETRREKDHVIVRIGIDTGPVYFMKGVGEGNIFWGPGIIMAKRVMDLCEANQILASERIAKDLRRLSEEHKAAIRPIGTYNIKHDENLEIFNIYGEGFGNKTSPKKGKEIKKGLELEQKKPKFEFNAVEIRLDVTNPKTMMTHHVWTWDMVNITENPLQHLFYSVGGDTPKDISDMNLKITDKNNDELDILSIEKDKPLEKEFIIKMKRPLRKNQKGRFKLEYDWEEPDRIFEFTFPTKCKKFRYVFTIPKGIKIKNRILETVKELGYKARVDPPPKMRFLKNRTEIVWETQKTRKINPYDSFEFQW